MVCIVGTGGGRIPVADYKRLYFFLFGASDRALRLLEEGLQSECPGARMQSAEKAVEILIGAQQFCEAVVLDAPDPPLRF